MTPLTPGHIIDALGCTIDHAPVPAERVLAGSPTEGYVTLDEIGGCEVGVWEMSAGVATDVESDEVFVVIAGRGTVTFDEATGLQPIELVIGSTVRLSAGMHTTWTVHETLRKIYVA